MLRQKEKEMETQRRRLRMLQVFRFACIRACSCVFVRYCACEDARVHASMGACVRARELLHVGAGRGRGEVITGDGGHG